MSTQVLNDVRQALLTYVRKNYDWRLSIGMGTELAAHRR